MTAATPAVSPPAAEFGQLLAPDTLRFERRLPCSVERAWSYLVDSQKRAQWLAPGVMEPRVGGRVHLQFHNLDLSPDKQPAPEKFAGVENCANLAGTITRFEAPRALGFTWGDRPAAPGEPAACGEASEVLFELVPEGDHTRLVITHRKLGIPTERLNVAGGWHTHLAILLDHLEGRTPGAFWPTHTAMEKAYLARLPQD